MDAWEKWEIWRIEKAVAGTKARHAALIQNFNPKEYLYNNIAFCPTNGCWLWLGPVLPKNDRAVISKLARRCGGQSSMYASHLMWKVEKGLAVPADRMLCHTCDTPVCVCPEHLYVGTHQSNTTDMWRRNRRVRQQGTRKCG